MAVQEVVEWPALLQQPLLDLLALGGGGGGSGGRAAGAADVVHRSSGCGRGPSRCPGLQVGSMIAADSRLLFESPSAGMRALLLDEWRDSEPISRRHYMHIVAISP